MGEYNKSLHQTKPFVTHLACARSAQIVFAGEANVSRPGGIVKRCSFVSKAAGVRFTICLCLILGGCQEQSQEDVSLELPEIVFLTREGCPGSSAVLKNLKDALADRGVAAAPVSIDLGDLAKEDFRTGYGTPTILVGGIDLFGRTKPKPATPM